MINFLDICFYSKISESGMPPIRLKDKYSEHFSLDTDEHDGTVTVNCHYCDSKHVIHEISFKSQVTVTLRQLLI